MSEKLATALRGISKPIFAAVMKGGELIVHVAAVPQRAAVREQIAAKAKAAGAHSVRVRFHNPEHLSAPRNLEKLVARFAGDEVVYDPTGSVTRAKALVAGGKTVRAALGAKLLGLFYAPRMRTLFVTLRAKSVLTGDKVKVADLAAIEHCVAQAMTEAFAPDECPAVRVGFGVPRVALVPIDRASAGTWTSRAVAALSKSWKPLTVATLFGLGAATAATASDPAVNQTNLKITGLGGQTSDEGAWAGTAAVTSPVGSSWGIQVEGGAFGVDDDVSWGAAGHIFTRDPDEFLVGFFAAYASESDFDLEATHFGAEAELYLNQVTLLAKAGYQFSDDVGDTPFGNVDVRWYVTDNFTLDAGGDFQDDLTVGRLEAEFMPGFSALPGLAFNVRGAVGDDDYDSIMGGITYYFGTNASLKDRHRKQDPDSALFGIFQSIEKERAQLAEIYGNPAPG